MKRFVLPLIPVMLFAFSGCPTPVNQAPVFDFLRTIEATTDLVVTLDGSAATDPDGDTLTFLWELTAVPPGSSLVVGSTDITNATSAVATFTPDVTGYYFVSFTVSDGSLSITRDTKVASGDLGLGLEAHYLLNGNANDASGNSPNGTATAVSWVSDRLGAAGNAASFDGSTSGIDVAKQDFTSATNTCTLSCWVRIDGTTSTSEYFLVTSGFGLFQNGSKIGFTIMGLTDNAFATVTQGAWHHVVGTYDGTDIKLYIDEILETTVNWPGTMTTTGSNCTMGYTGTDYWDGIVDDVWMFRRVIEYAEIGLLHLYDAY
jgi:hypothetical protein